MDVNIIELFFTCGKFFALTPSSTKNEKVECPQKFYEIAIFLLYTASFISTSLYTSAKYGKLTSIQFVLAILWELNQFLNTFFLLVVLMRFKRPLWSKLTENLYTIPHKIKHTRSHYVVLGLGCLIYVTGTTLGIYAYISQTGPLATLQTCGSTFFHNICQFFYILLTCVIFKLLLSKYQQQKNYLIQITKAKNVLHLKQMLEILKKVKVNIFGLKETVEIFNEIFGWPILFQIFSSSSRTLIYIDMVIKHDGTVGGSFNIQVNPFGFFYEVGCIVIEWVGLLVMIFLCDAILNETEEILAETYKLENSLNDLNTCEEEEVQMFIDVVLHNRPEFRAARFFSIDRSTLFSILNSLTTFLLVMIQFKAN